MRKQLALGALAAFAALAYAESASAHAQVSPPVALAKESQVFTLAVPTEKEGATTTSIEFTPPAGFSIDSFIRRRAGSERCSRPGPARAPRSRR